ILDDYLVIRFKLEDQRTLYLMPTGKGNILPVIETLAEEAAREHQPLLLQGVYSEMQATLEKNFPTLFEYTSHRDYYDYIYLRKDLAELKGKNYQPKRNHVNKFKKEYKYEYLPLTADILPDCLDFELRWCMEHDCLQKESLQKERQALTYAVQHYEELGLYGGAITVKGEIVAFTFGFPVTPDTFDVQFEKANIHIDGAYSIINQEFARHLPETYIYVNREEDLGMPGLRQAKLSYHPAILLEKCIATQKTIR
ncbi:MAG: phosphatidylglycerol lysyltransferase domain-containing protein, partial [Odoribacter sp.]|nr:phosphatidylglycerol lysyltransferase domain-containing protein [Odoribacter sp.]